MMKKLLCLLLSIAIAVSVCGVIPIATAAESIEYDSRNEFEDKYNIAYYSNIGSWDGELSSTKIQTVEELNQCTTDSDILSKYNESFFENKFLIWIDYGAPDPAHELRVTSVSNSENEIDIEIITSYSQNVSVIDVTCDWDILLEVESADIDKEVVVTTAEDMEHWLGDISYYEGYIKNTSAPSYGMAPSVAKVNSLESLAESWSGSMSDIEKYDEDFFEENFLLFVSWIETSSLQTYQISSILDDGEKINVELSEFIPEGEGATVMTPYSAIIEVPLWLYDREFSATAVELEPEPTATPIPYPTTDPSMLEYLTFDKETGTITKCDTSISGDLIIPAEIDGVAVTEIGSSAFASCRKLTSVTVPGSVKKIGNYAFYNNWKLETVTIYNGVTSIGDTAFGSCKVMTSVSIPDSVTSIGNDAFYYCSKLEAVTIPSNLTELGDYAFKYCTALTNITIPRTLSSIPADAFYGDTNLTSVTIEDGVESIGTNAFYGCKGLTEIELPESVESISDNAFANCEQLKKVIIPKSVTSIGANVFGGVSEEFAIYGYGDSYAETYANENGITFIDVTAPEPNQAEKDYNISYYDGGIGNESTADEMQPYGNKITSVAGLESLSMSDTELREEIIAKYDDAFFEEKFLIVISWVELQNVRLKLVGEVSVDEDDFSIVMSEREYNEEVTSVIAPYCAILEVPMSEDDKALMLDDKYFYVPSICVLPIYVPAPEVDTESGMVAYGTEITISPVNDNSVAYSINGSEFVYEKEAVKLSITEDTELVVKSRVDNPDPDPDAQYMIDENTYMYTIDPATIPVDGKYEVTFENITYMSVYTDSSMSEIAEAPYKTTDGNLYFFIAVAPGSGTLTLTSSCGTIEYLGEMSTDDYFYGYKYLLSGVTENTVVSADYYTGPELEIFTATLNMDGTVTTKVSAGYANASAPNGTVIVGAYDENGVLLSVKMYDCTGLTETLTWADIPTVTTFKAMWWDSVNTMTPLTESYVMSVDMEVPPTFKPIQIIATAGDGGTVTGNGFYEYGETVTLTATPDDGYHFVGWYEDGIILYDSTATYSFVAEESRNLEARFRLKLSGGYTPVYIMATAGEGGTVTGEDMYFYDDIVELTATPDE